jgi:hypothetical protein
MKSPPLPSSHCEETLEKGGDEAIIQNQWKYGLEFIISDKEQSKCSFNHSITVLKNNDPLLLSIVLL